jgi:hypothetical protein
LSTAGFVRIVLMTSWPELCTVARVEAVQSVHIETSETSLVHAARKLDPDDTFRVLHADTSDASGGPHR